MHTQQNSHFLDANPLFLFRVHVIDISSIDEQHIKQRKKKMMMKKKVVRFYTSLHYVIDVCHIYTIPRLSLYSS
jgi:hypothetical protein